jgi:hypothetical protein
MPGTFKQKGFLFAAITAIAFFFASADIPSETAFTLQQKKKYKYGPAVSVLTGKLKFESFWGPPNFGEDTTIDRKETMAILYLQKPIDIAGVAGDEFDIAQTNVYRIQLIHGRDLKNYAGKEITVKGTLFGAHSPHHRTEVLLNMMTINSKP